MQRKVCTQAHLGGHGVEVCGRGGLAVVAWQVSGIPRQGWGDEVSE